VNDYKYFYKALISAFSLRGVGPYGPEAANSAVNYYEKTDTNKTIHIGCHRRSDNVFPVVV